MAFLLVLYAVPTVFTAVFAVRAFRSAGLTPAAAVAVLNRFAGVTTVWWMIVHTLFSVGARLAGEESAKALTHPDLVIGPLKYDFRLYALVLMAAVIAGHGWRLVAASARMTRGEPAGAVAAWSATLRLLVLAVPLLPLRNANGGGSFVILLLVNVGALLALRWRQARVVAPQAAPA